MNKLFLLALVGFVLAIGLALPFNEDGDNLSNDLNSEDAERNLDWDPEDDVDENEDEDYEYDDDDDDDDDDDQEDEDDDNALSNPLKKSSDPFIRRFVRGRRIVRRVRRVFRRFRRRRSRRG
ncbi:uncharacterized protein LOC144661169 [Oculina patagonica]